MAILPQVLLALAAIFATVNAGYWLPGATGPVGATRTTATTTTTTASGGTTVAPGSGGQTAKAFPDDLFLANVNAYRADHNASALTTDATLKSKAAACAEGYAKLTAGVTNGGTPAAYCNDTGTGIDYFYTGGNSTRSVTGMITLWYNEACTVPYNYATPTVPLTTTEHFTQLVWKATTQVGCAFSSSTNTANTAEYVTVCIFSPPGNNGRSTQYIANVEKPAEECPASDSSGSAGSAQAATN